MTTKNTIIDDLGTEPATSAIRFDVPGTGDCAIYAAIKSVLLRSMVDEGVKKQVHILFEDIINEYNLDVIADTKYINKEKPDLSQTFLDDLSKLNTSDPASVEDFAKRYFEKNNTSKELTGGDKTLLSLVGCLRKACIAKCDETCKTLSKDELYPYIDVKDGETTDAAKIRLKEQFSPFKEMDPRWVNLLLPPDLRFDTGKEIENNLISTGKTFAADTTNTAPSGITISQEGEHFVLLIEPAIVNKLQKTLSAEPSQTAAVNKNYDAAAEVININKIHSAIVELYTKEAVFLQKLHDTKTIINVSRWGGDLVQNEFKKEQGQHFIKTIDAYIKSANKNLFQPLSLDQSDQFLIKSLRKNSNLLDKNGINGNNFEKEYMNLISAKIPTPNNPEDIDKIKNIIENISIFFGSEEADTLMKNLVLESAQTARKIADIDSKDKLDDKDKPDELARNYRTDLLSGIVLISEPIHMANTREQSFQDILDSVESYINESSNIHENALNLAEDERSNSHLSVLEQLVTRSQEIKKYSQNISSILEMTNYIETHKEEEVNPTPEVEILSKIIAEHLNADESEGIGFNTISQIEKLNNDLELRKNNLKIESEKSGPEKQKTIKKEITSIDDSIKILNNIKKSHAKEVELFKLKNDSYKDVNNIRYLTKEWYSTEATFVQSLFEIKLMLAKKDNKEDDSFATTLTEKECNELIESINQYISLVDETLFKPIAKETGKDVDILAFYEDRAERRINKDPLGIGPEYDFNEFFGKIDGTYEDHDVGEKVLEFLNKVSVFFEDKDFSDKIINLFTSSTKLLQLNEISSYKSTAAATMQRAPRYVLLLKEMDKSITKVQESNPQLFEIISKDNHLDNMIKVSKNLAQTFNELQAAVDMRKYLTTVQTSDNTSPTLNKHIYTTPSEVITAIHDHLEKNKFNNLSIENLNEARDKIVLYENLFKGYQNDLENQRLKITNAKDKDNDNKNSLSKIRKKQERIAIEIRKISVDKDFIKSISDIREEELKSYTPSKNKENSDDTISNKRPLEAPTRRFGVSNFLHNRREKGNENKSVHRTILNQPKSTIHISEETIANNIDNEETNNPHDSDTENYSHDNKKEISLLQAIDKLPNDFCAQERDTAQEHNFYVLRDSEEPNKAVIKRKDKPDDNANNIDTTIVTFTEDKSNHIAEYDSANTRDATLVILNTVDQMRIANSKNYQITEPLVNDDQKAHAYILAVQAFCIAKDPQKRELENISKEDLINLLVEYDIKIKEPSKLFIDSINSYLESNDNRMDDKTKSAFKTYLTDTTTPKKGNQGMLISDIPKPKGRRWSPLGR